MTIKKKARQSLMEIAHSLVPYRYRRKENGSKLRGITPNDTSNTMARGCVELY
jgi:hypothetical protein